MRPINGGKHEVCVHHSSELKLCSRSWCVDVKEQLAAQFHTCDLL